MRKFGSLLLVCFATFGVVAISAAPGQAKPKQKPEAVPAKWKTYDAYRIKSKDLRGKFFVRGKRVVWTIKYRSDCTRNREPFSRWGSLSVGSPRKISRAGRFEYEFSNDFGENSHTELHARVRGKRITGRFADTLSYRAFDEDESSISCHTGERRLNPWLKLKARRIG